MDGKDLSTSKDGHHHPTTVKSNCSVGMSLPLEICITSKTGDSWGRRSVSLKDWNEGGL